MENTNHRGSPVGKPYSPTTQSAQATAPSSFTAPSAGISASLDSDTPSPIGKSKGLGDSLREAASSYTSFKRDQMFYQSQMDRKASEPEDSPASTPAY